MIQKGIKQMMKRKCLPLFLVWILIVFFFAPQAFAQRAAADQSRSFMWEVKSATTTVYILGSIHFANPDLYPLPTIIEDAFEKSSVLVVEVNPLTINLKRVKKIVQKKGMYPDGESLQGSISDKLLSDLRGSLEKHKIPIQGFISMKPGLCAITLASVLLMKMGYSPDYGIDQYFAKKATGKKPIIELETIDQQLSLIFDMPDQELFLKYTLSDIAKGENFMAKTVEQWKAGDAEALFGLLLKPYAKDPQFKPILDKMYFDRNFKMAARIEGFLKIKKTYFVVVGAAHLIGEKGIIKILEKRNYKVRQFAQGE